MNIVGLKKIDVSENVDSPILGVKLFVEDQDCPCMNDNGEGFGYETSNYWVDGNRMPAVFHAILDQVKEPGDYDIRLNKKGKISEIQPGLGVK